MSLLARQFRKTILNKEIKIGMTELAKVTGVSTSQIRYWERKGYIHSEQDQQNKNHYFSILMVYKVYIIKFYLDQGYTLQMAVQKEREQRKLGEIFKKFLTDCIINIQQQGEDQGEVVLGTLAEEPNKEVYAKIKHGEKTTLHLREAKD